jgi:membrane protease YdiL (CAAX protease family)
VKVNANHLSRKKGKLMLNIDWAAGLGGLAFIGVIYAWNRWCRGTLSKWLVAITPLQRSMPLRTAELLVRVPLYGIPGIVVYTCLSIIDPRAVIPIHFDLLRMFNGIVLGVGLLASGLALSQFVFLQAVSKRQIRNQRSHAFADLAAFGETGWVRGYNIVRQRLPYLGYLLTAFSILGEELGFRGVALALLATGFGPVFGIVISSLAFTGIQKMNMPTWSIALIPMTSALLMGLVHAYLALTVRDMTLLFISHCTFFIFSNLLFGLRKGAREKTQPRVWSRQGG